MQGSFYTDSALPGGPKTLCAVSLKYIVIRYNVGSLELAAF